MKKLFVLLFLLFIPSIAHAEEVYSVEQPDGSVAIVHYKEGSIDTINDVIISLGFDAPGYSVRKISTSEIPKERVDRKYWTVLGKKIGIDEDQKTEDLSVELQKESEKQAVLEKLKLTEEEAELLKKI